MSHLTALHRLLVVAETMLLTVPVMLPLLPCTLTLYCVLVLRPVSVAAVKLVVLLLHLPDAPLLYCTVYEDAFALFVHLTLSVVVLPVGGVTVTPVILEIGHTGVETTQGQPIALLLLYVPLAFLAVVPSGQVILFVVPVHDCPIAEQELHFVSASQEQPVNV